MDDYIPSQGKPSPHKKDKLVQTPSGKSHVQAQISEQQYRDQKQKLYKDKLDQEDKTLNQVRSCQMVLSFARRYEDVEREYTRNSYGKIHASNQRQMLSSSSYID